jgi:hypothetical protein
VTAPTFVRLALAAGWLVLGFLAERILTQGTIGDAGQLGNDSPAEIVIGVGLIVVALCMAFIVARGAGPWATANVVLGFVFVGAGTWYLSDLHDSGTVIVALAAAEAAAGLVARTRTRRGRDTGGFDAI